VLPLCAGHHQKGTGPNPSLIAVHPNKARFEERYGSQMELLDECGRLTGYIDATPVEIRDDHEKVKEAA
jgi:hypothetical protein